MVASPESIAQQQADAAALAQQQTQQPAGGKLVKQAEEAPAQANGAGKHCFLIVVVIWAF